MKVVAPTLTLRFTGRDVFFSCFLPVLRAMTEYFFVIKQLAGVWPGMFIVTLLKQDPFVFSYYFMMPAVSDVLFLL